MYALSGIVLIFRSTDVFKKVNHIEKVIDKGVAAKELGPALDIKRLKVTKEEEGILYFKDGEYNANTGAATYTVKELPYVLDKMTHLHKANTNDPLFFLNIFFGLGLLFFVISAFWMYMPSSTIFKKGIKFTIAGIILTLILLFL